jgi:3-deoxy-manno-octulosonate cytidylyltransferase (CMP-KDO synthetase)
MKIVAFIPARYQSTRFPGKPLATIWDRPMIQHVYERAVSCTELSEVYVATDDERIAECVRGFHGKVVMTRTDHRSGTDRISEAVEKMKLEPKDIVVNIQGDQPLFQSSIVAQLVKPLVEDDSIPMATLMCKITEESDLHNPNHVKVVTDQEGFAIYFSRYPIPFIRDAGTAQIHYKHLGFYSFRKHFLKRFTDLPEGRLEIAERLEQLRALEHGFRIKVCETGFDSVEVDVPEDVRKVEAMIRGSHRSTQ